MDDIANYNRTRWRALAAADALFTRPRTDLDAASAREIVDPEGVFGDLTGKQVLCLAGGGGKQSVAFALLGAEVTVFDLSDEQLDRDRQMAAHYGLNLTIIQGDMRDLSALAESHFDLVYQPYALNFVPDSSAVFAQVRRVMKPGGLYEVMCANPYAAGLSERDWNGAAYPVSKPYIQGQRIEYEDQEWVYDREQHAPIVRPVEYRQTLSALVTGLATNGFVILHVREFGAFEPDPNAEPGTWEHFSAILPPWWIMRTVFQPDLLNRGLRHPL